MGTVNPLSFLALANKGLDFLKGAGKSAGETVGSLDHTSLGQSINSAILGPQEAQKESQAYDKLIAPGTSVPEKLGRGAEQMAEFGLIGPEKFGINELPEAARLAAKIGGDSAKFGTLAAVHHESPAQGAVVGGLLGAVPELMPTSKGIGMKRLQEILKHERK